jgi:hypothetical protein
MLRKLLKKNVEPLKLFHIQHLKFQEELVTKTEEKQLTVEEEFNALTEQEKENYLAVISKELKIFQSMSTDKKVATMEFALIREGEFSCVEERLNYESQGYRPMSDDELKHRKYLILFPFLLSIPAALLLVFFALFNKNDNF